jgi:hypothetical protein
MDHTRACMHDIQMILENVAAQSEPAIPQFVPLRLSGSRDWPIGFSALLKAGQNSEIDLIRDRATLPEALPAEARCIGTHSRPFEAMWQKLTKATQV